MLGRKKVTLPELPQWPGIEEMFTNVKAFVNEPAVATGLVVCFSMLVLAVMMNKTKEAKRKAVSDFLREMLGTIVMIFCCFTPGPVLGHLGGYEEWIAHGVGVIVADYLAGGPHVNPAVSVAMFVWRKLPLDHLVLFVAAQVAGGILAFPALQFLASPYGVTIGGPGITDDTDVVRACWDEGVGTFALLSAVFLFCTTWLGQHYHVKQPMVAIAIRVIIIHFGSTGPAVNPMLATTWAFYQSGSTQWPEQGKHYVIFWGASVAGAAAAALLWSLLWTDGVFAPHKPPPPVGPATTKEAWKRYLKAFNGLGTEESYTAILKLYSAEVQLLLSTARPAALAEAGAPTTEAGKKAAKAAAKVVVSKRGVKSAAKWLTRGAKETVVEGVVDEATRSVFVKWHSAQMDGTETLLFDENYLILRQHTTIYKPH